MGKLKKGKKMHVYCVVCIKYNDPSESMITVSLCGNTYSLYSRQHNTIYLP
jgi:hypothetical protein